MSFDENELRRALEARSGEPSPGYRARLRQSLAGASPRPAAGWTAAIAVIVVTLLTATSVGILVAARHGRPGPVASGPRVTSPSPSVESSDVYLSAPSKDVVWALVGGEALFVSTDGGARWDQRTLPSSPGVRPAISFIDGAEGWLLAPGSPTTQCGEAPASIWHTTDGAKTWRQLQIAGLGAAQCKELVYFSDAGRGFVTAWDDNHQPSVYWSNDGGVGWKKSTLPDPPDFKSGPGGFTLRVEWIKTIGRTVYLEAYGTQGASSPYPDIPMRQYIFLSANGGGTWSWKQKVASREVALVTQQRWLEIDPPAQLDESINGGQQMHPYESDLRIDQAATTGQLVFADENVGYELRGGTLQRTVNGGAHWTLVATPWSRSVSPAPSPAASPTPGYFMPTPVQLDAPAGDVVWAFIPYDKVLFLSTDRGDHWTVRNLPPDTGSASPNVTFLDAEEGWYLGGGAATGACATEQVKIWHTVDGAETWQAVDTSGIPEGQCKEDLVFVDRTHAFMTSQEQNLLPKVYRSSDGGRTWTASTLSDPAGFQSVPDGFAFSARTVKTFGSTALVTAAGNGFLSAKSGEYVYRSTDSGAHWSLAATLPNSPGSSAVIFFSPTRWLIVQGPSGGMQTTDGGKTWQSFTTDYADAAGVASSFVFVNSQVGYGTVRGSFHRTLDGGVHWALIGTPWLPAA